MLGISLFREYKIPWIFYRLIYAMKLKTLRLVPSMDTMFEKKIKYPIRLDYFDIDIKGISAILDNLDEGMKNDIVNRADRALIGIIKGFSFVNLDYGCPIDWHLNPATGMKTPDRLKWFQIPDFDGRVGDIKNIWEASRFSQFVLFARAYILTLDRKYYEGYKSQLKNWLLENPYSYGANYKCGQECSIRMSNCLLAYCVFKKYDLIDCETENDVKEIVFRSYKKVLSNFFYAYRCIKNDHTFSELMGMIVGSWCCDEEKRECWAVEKLNKQIEEQFSDDGGYKSYSFNYERMVFQDLEFILSNSHRLNNLISNSNKHKLLRAIELLYQCQNNRGELPNYGQNDGSLIFQLSACDYKDFRPTMNSLFMLLSNTRLYEKGIYDEEFIWFSNGADVPEKKYKNERRSQAYYEAGIYTLVKNDSQVMIVLNAYTKRPIHMDQLHFDLWIDGINVFCDTGTYSYASELGLPLIYTEGHNTAKVGFKQQMNTFGKFILYDWTKSKLIEKSEDTFEGEIRSKNGYVHRRRIEWKENAYHVRDDVTSRTNEKVSVLFHTPCDIKMFKDEVQICNNGTYLCSVRSSNKITIKETYRSIYYERLDKINCICIEGISNSESIETWITIGGKY